MLKKTTKDPKGKIKIQGNLVKKEANIVPYITIVYK